MRTLLVIDRSDGAIERIPEDSGNFVASVAIAAERLDLSYDEALHQLESGHTLATTGFLRRLDRLAGITQRRKGAKEESMCGERAKTIDSVGRVLFPGEREHAAAHKLILERDKGVLVVFVARPNLTELSRDDEARWTVYLPCGGRSGRESTRLITLTCAHASQAIRAVRRFLRWNVAQRRAAYARQRAGYDLAPALLDWRAFTGGRGSVAADVDSGVGGG